MSRANESAYPTGEVSNGNGDIIEHGSIGLTIREHASLAFATAIVASGRKGSSDVIGVMVEADEYTREWLKEFAK